MLFIALALSHGARRVAVWPRHGEVDAAPRNFYKSPHHTDEKVAEPGVLHERMACS